MDNIKLSSLYFNDKYSANNIKITDSIIRIPNKYSNNITLNNNYLYNIMQFDLSKLIILDRLIYTSFGLNKTTKHNKTQKKNEINKNIEYETNR